MLEEEIIVEDIGNINRKCHYKGQVNEYNQPNGIGRAVDDWGLIYEGIFEHGSLTVPHLKIDNEQGLEYVMLMD